MIAFLMALFVSHLLLMALKKNGYILTGPLSDLSRFLASESPLKIMKNAFYFNSKSLSVFKVSKFFPWIFRHVETRFD